MRPARILLGLGVLAIGTSSCVFDPPGTGGLAPIGAPCERNEQCTLAMCNVRADGVGECVECRQSSHCRGDKRCDVAVGRCIVEPPAPSVTRDVSAGLQIDGRGRRHHGRVAVIPVTSFIQTGIGP